MSRSSRLKARTSLHLDGRTFGIIFMKVFQLRPTLVPTKSRRKSCCDFLISEDTLNKTERGFSPIDCAIYDNSYRLMTICHLPDDCLTIA